MEPAASVLVLVVVVANLWVGVNTPSKNALEVAVDDDVNLVEDENIAGTMTCRPASRRARAVASPSCPCSFASVVAAATAAVVEVEAVAAPSNDRISATSEGVSGLSWRRGWLTSVIGGCSVEVCVCGVISLVLL